MFQTNIFFQDVCKGSSYTKKPFEFWQPSNHKRCHVVFVLKFFNLNKNFLFLLFCRRIPIAKWKQRKRFQEPWRVTTEGKVKEKKYVRTADRGT